MSEPTDRAELEDRIRKLEAALAERPATDEVTDRVIEKLSAMAAERERNPESGRMLVLASPASAAPPPPQGAVLHPPAPVEATERRWFLHQVAVELRLVATMYFDPRYRISRTTQFALPGIVLVMIFNYFFFSMWVNIMFLSPVAERLLIVILTLLGYKLMTRELTRYREVLDYLARYGGK
jgi:hypothetical protein